MFFTFKMQEAVKACFFGDVAYVKRSEMLFRNRVLNTSVCLEAVLPNPNDPSFGHSQAPATNFVHVSKADRLTIIKHLVDYGAVIPEKALSAAIYCDWYELLEYLLSCNTRITCTHLYVLAVKGHLRNPRLIIPILERSVLLPTSAIITAAYFAFHETNIEFVWALIKYGLCTGEQIIDSYKVFKSMKFEHETEIWVIIKRFCEHSS
jgi:hypothetical protein